jgi:RHS repeat-associated protein
MRASKAGPHGETLYVNAWYSVKNGAIASKHVFAGGARIASKVKADQERRYFYHGDHLGSSNFVTDDLGKAWQHLEYFPSGEVWADERSETQRTPYLFGGKELDEETGLSYFGFRYYDARQGQWLSADPILDELLDTKKLSRPDLSVASFHLPGLVYGYAGNSPTNFVDPMGLSKHQRFLFRSFGYFRTYSTRASRQILTNKTSGDTAAQALQTEVGGKQEVCFRTSHGTRRVDVLTDNNEAYESKVGRTSATEFIKKEVQKDVYLRVQQMVKNVTWVFFQSKQTGKGGPTKPLRQLLQKENIQIDVRKDSY